VVRRPQFEKRWSKGYRFYSKSCKEKKIFKFNLKDTISQEKIKAYCKRYIHSYIRTFSHTLKDTSLEQTVRAYCGRYKRTAKKEGVCTSFILT